jgi:hypothetical protein
MSEPVTVSVPSLLSVDIDESGRVKGWRVVEGITPAVVQRSVETARIWREEDASVDCAWDRHMERLESTRDDGPEEGPEVGE